MPTPPPVRTGRDRARAALERDAALGRIGRVRFLVVAGSAAASAGLVGVVAATAPGHAVASPARGVASTQGTRLALSSTAASSLPAPALPPLEGPAALGLQGPGQAPGDDSSASSSASSQSDPAPAPQPPVVSGGS